MAPLRRRCVLDTNEIVGAGSRWVSHRIESRPNPHLRLLGVVMTHHTGLYSEDILLEYSRKLLARRSPKPRVLKMISRLRENFEKVSVTTSPVPVPPRDPDDEKFLRCALDGDADYLVSEDRDLLDLSAEYARPAIVNCAGAL